MKYIFGINITENKNNTTIDGQIFQSNCVNPTLMEAYQTCDTIQENNRINTSLPGWLQLVEYISMSAGCFLLAEMISVYKSINVFRMYSDRPIIFSIITVLLITALILYLIGDRKKKEYEDTDEYKNNVNYTYNVAERAKDTFAVPEDAKIIEVLMFYYKVQNGKMKVVEKKNALAPGIISYDNFEVYSYVKAGNLYFTDLYEEWEIPLYCFTGIKKVNKKIRVTSWKKEVPCNKGKYKKYKMVENQVGVFFKPYYAFSITWNEEQYELLIPPYELEELSALVNLHYNEMYI